MDQTSIFKLWSRLECVDDWFAVFVDDTSRDDDRPPFVRCSDPVEGETTRKTGHGTEERLESFRKMMGDVILVDLDHSPPGALFVIYLSFTTDTNDLRIVSSAGYQSVQRLGSNGLQRLIS